MNVTNGILGGLAALTGGLLFWRCWLWLADRRFRRELDLRVKARLETHATRDCPPHE